MDKTLQTETESGGLVSRKWKLEQMCVLAWLKSDWCQEGVLEGFHPGAKGAGTLSNKHRDNSQNRIKGFEEGLKQSE